MHRIQERLAERDRRRRRRLDDKDALDTLRLLQASPTDALAETFAQLLRADVCATVTDEALTALLYLFAEPRAPGAQMACVPREHSRRQTKSPDRVPRWHRIFSLPSDVRASGNDSRHVWDVKIERHVIDTRLFNRAFQSMFIGKKRWLQGRATRGTCSCGGASLDGRTWHLRSHPKPFNKLRFHPDRMCV